MGEFVVKHRLAGESQIIITIIHLYGGIPHSYYSCNCYDFSPDLPRHRHYALCVPSDDCSTRYHPPSNLTSTSCPQRRCLSIVYYNKINCNKENVARARLASVLRPVCSAVSCSTPATILPVNYCLVCRGYRHWARHLGSQHQPNTALARLVLTYWLTSAWPTMSRSDARQTVWAYCCMRQW